MAKWKQPCRHMHQTIGWRLSSSTRWLSTCQGARPLFFQRSANLTPQDLSGTASILAPQHRHLSPCLGAALATSPFVGNLMRLGQRLPEEEVGVGAKSDQDDGKDPQNLLDKRLSKQLSQSSFLANNLFFQMIRESPVHLVRNKSLPASYLTPALVGGLLGHFMSTDSNEKTIRAALKRDFGIRSNHLGDNQWTGISVARWMDLVVQGDDTTNHSSLHSTLVPALWLTALWGLASSRDCLLDYYKALEQTGQIQIDAASLNDWPSFAETDFSSSNLHNAMDRLIHYYSQPCTYTEYKNHHHSNAGDDIALSARSLELVCASIALQQYASNTTAMPVLPNGYYSFDGGDVRADCVEVAMREIFYLLLWDETQGSLDVSRLANSACPRLMQLLRDESNWIKSGTNRGDIDFGRKWFDLLSNREKCIYMSESPNGKPYELAPTIEGISIALCSLFVLDGKHPQATKELKRPWQSLQGLVDFWNSHRPDYPLYVHEDTLRHKKSNGEVVEHEIAMLGCDSSKRAMEIRLRCDWDEACGMAAVTRLAEQQAHHELNQDQVQQLRDLLCANGDVRASHDPSLAMLCLALPPKNENIQQPKSPTANVLNMLATPYGPDRRMILFENVDEFDGAADRNRNELIKGRQVLKEEIVQACHICQQYPMLGTQMLCWIIRESPTVVERSKSMPLPPDGNCVEIEKAILTLPTAVLENESLLRAIDYNWACRETSVALKVKRKLGKASILDSFAGFKAWLG